MTKYFQLILFLGLVYTLTFQTRAQESCIAQPVDEAIFTDQSGQLLYISSLSSRDALWRVGELWRVGSKVRDDRSNFRGITISPDASRIAWLEVRYDRGIPLQSDIVVLDVTTGSEVSLHMFANDSFMPFTIQWMGNTTLLLLYVPLVDVGTEYIPFSTVDIDTLEISYVYPPFYQYQFDEYGFESTALLTYPDGVFDNYPSFSPNGYLVIDENVIGYSLGSILYDLDNREVLEINNLRGWIWSPDSQILLDLDSELDEDRNRIYDLYQYDIAQDSSQHIYSFGNVGDQRLTSDTDGLSATGLLAIGRTVPHVNTQLEILDIEAGELLVTCFVESSSSNFDFEWSLDGRYLAFFGTQKDKSGGGVYIYDSLTQVAYSVYSDDADIVGWSNLLN